MGSDCGERRARSARLQAPLAITTDSARISPWSVVTSYPSPVRRTEVTSVPVRTGASEAAANPSMKSATSSALM